VLGVHDPTERSSSLQKQTKRVAALVSALLAIAAVGPVSAVAAKYQGKHSTVHHRVVKKSAAVTESAGRNNARGSDASSSESTSESTVSDGPGGHEDPAGAETDHQFEGEE
jgi:hypothetical protein